MLLPPSLLPTLFCALSLLAAASIAAAQTFPVRPIRIVTSEPGSGTDLVARLVAQGLTERLGKQAIVENRGGMVSPDVVQRAAPDGHTLLLSGTSLWLAPFLRDTATHDPLRDFTPVTLAAGSPSLLAVHPSLPVESARDVVALARSRPRDLNYSSGSTGSPTHLSAELFKFMAGVDIVRVTYKGTGPALNALVAGEVHIMFVTTATAVPHIRAGRLKALAVTTAEPSALAPGLPTVAATLPGYESTALFALFAPAKTPPALVKLLNREIVEVLSRREVRERLFNAGTEAIASSPEALAATMRSDMAKWGKLIRAAGIQTGG
jgi:tripartite-type tricarboxylate transporter receptor subunit TctC